MSNKFGKTEKLKSEKVIGQLFEEGQYVTLHPLRLHFMKREQLGGEGHKLGVAVSKRNFKSAVARNRIKRLLREAYRLNKSDFFNNTVGQYAFMVSYLGKDVPDFDLIDSKIKLLFGKFSAVVAKEN